MTPLPAAAWVIDASALLAHLLAEPGGDLVRDALAERGAVMSAVNWTEVLSKFAAAGQDPVEVAERILSNALLGRALIIEPLTATDAPRIAALRPLTKDLGLSFADRACLALAERLAASVLTTDSTWRNVDLQLDIRIARPGPGS